MGFWQYLALIGVGALVGGFSGLLGIGGGTIIVPALVILFGMSQYVGQGTSLAVMVPVALVGAACYGAQKHVHLGAALALAAGAVVTARCTAGLAQHLPENVLRYIFSLFLVIVAAQMVPAKAGLPQQAGFIALAAVALVVRGLLVK
jgi:uncharacterized membrane protein YfcA